MDLRRLAGIERLLPACRAQAPAIARLQTGKAGRWSRARQIVAGRPRKREEPGIDLRADGVHAEILGSGLAAAGPIESGQGFRAAFGERFAENVARPPWPAGIGTGSIGHGSTPSFTLGGGRR